MRRFKTVSRDYQDEFVQRLFEGKPGYFFDVACNNGRHSNNTFILEQEGWIGTLIDDSKALMDMNSKFRRQRCCVADLRQTNFYELLNADSRVPRGQNMEIHIDYLSIGPSMSVEAIIKGFPWNLCRFKVMTFHHHGAESLKKEMRNLMMTKGYMLLAGDIIPENTLGTNSYEDWYVDPVFFDSKLLQRLKSSEKRGIDIIYKPKHELPFRIATNSADLQDEFVQRLFAGATGRFLDVGSGRGTDTGNNTLMLEKAGWSGFLVDLQQEAYEANKKERKVIAVCADVTKCDWHQILDISVSDKTTFDYISFDVDDATIPAVERFPWNTIRFRVCTIEHDAYQRDSKARYVIREKMALHGYMLLAGDVCADFVDEPYEDWFIDPTTFEPNIYERYFSHGFRAADVIFTPR